MSTATTMPLSEREHLGRRRVVVTGVGAVTPVGLTAADTWQGLLVGRSGISLITRFDASVLPVRIAGEIRDFQPEAYMDRKEVRRTSRASHLVVAAVRMALADAQFPENVPDPDRTGTSVGTGAGGLEVVDRELTTLRTRGFDRINPFALTGFLANMPAYHVSLVTGAHGPINTVAAACASGAQAVADGAEWIRSGRADVVVAAGVEGVIELPSIGGFARINALSTRNDDPAHACRPFDKGRDGTVLSEGSGALILESLDHATARNATIYGEILGFATSSDAYHVTAPDPQAGGMVRADVVVAAGVEGVIELPSIGGFARINALSTRNDDPAHACRPFDKGRDGTVLSEGSGALILESLDHATARNATIYGEILGFATSSDAYHVTAPDPQAGGMVRAIRWSLEDAGVTPQQIDYINAHATATPLNDSMETLAIKTVFGEDAYRVPISGSKALLGHTLGGTGAIEAIICLLAMRDNIIPPTWNYSEPDPACDLDYVPNQPRPAQLNTVLSNSFAMGGHNCCLVFGRFENSAAH